jgi:hypothetical protein
MFGYDDDELNDILMAKATDPNVTMLVTLDKSQAGGKHEKMLLDADKQHALAEFNTHFVIGQSATHQISHTKGFVADNKAGCEGSVNWSASGEGTFIVNGKPGGPGFKAQNNTPDDLHRPRFRGRFQTELIAEHVTAQKQDNAPPERRQRILPVGKIIAPKSRRRERFRTGSDRRGVRRGHRGGQWCTGARAIFRHKVARWRR